MTDFDPVLPEGAAKKKQEIFLLAAAFFVPLLLLGILRTIASFAGGEPGTDAFYHVKMGLLGPEVFCAKEFPVLVSSFWQETFADKELFYHLLLWGLNHLRKLVTGEEGAPFHFQTLFFCGLALAGFIRCLYCLRIPPSIIFLASLLLPFSASSFAYRFLMLRPHVYSLFLLLLYTSFLAEEKWNRKGKAILSLLMGIFYSWSYSNSHFLLIPACFYSFFDWRESREKKAFFLPLFTAAGLFLGGILHPQFPNTFLIWKVQGIDAMLGPLAGMGFSSRLAPMEMQPGGIRWHLNNIPFYILLYFILLLFCRLRERGKTGFSPVEKMIFLMGVLFSCGLFFALRSVEIAAPFVVLSFAVLLKRVFAEKLSIPLLPYADFPLKRYCLLLLFTLLFLLQTSLFLLGSAYRTKSPGTIAEYLQWNNPSGRVVCNLDWGDFPAMFFASGMKLSQLWGMDPVFSYKKDPKLAREIERAVINSIYVPGMDRKLHELTGGYFAFLLSHRKTFIRNLKRQNWKVVFENEEGAVFALVPLHYLNLKNPPLKAEAKGK